MDGETMLSTVIGTVAGGAIGALINWWFSHRSSKELQATARELKHEVQLKG